MNAERCDIVIYLQQHSKDGNFTDCWSKLRDKLFLRRQCWRSELKCKYNLKILLFANVLKYQTVHSLG